MQDIYSSKIGLISFFLFLSFMVFLLFLSLSLLRKKYNASPYILISLVLSFVFFFSVERGNIIILSAASVGFFICYYDSKNKYKRMLAAIALAMAAVLKIYPVLFGFLYFQKKQYREIILSASITLLFIFLPFLFFKRGFANIPRIIDNFRGFWKYTGIQEAFERFSLAHLLLVVLLRLKFSYERVIIFCNLAQSFSNLLSFISILFSCLIKNKWLKISLLTMVVVFLPVVSGWYCGLYMFPMIILFFSTLEERSKRFNIFIFIVFIIFLNPYQITFGYDFSFNYLICNVALLSFWLVLLVYSGRQIAASKIILTIKAAVTNKLSAIKESLS
jgi:hypothetical protein